MKNESQDLGLQDLSREVEKLLEENRLLEAQPDGRVNAAPDARTVRYYGTLGLVDRPSIVDREARYGRRHVLQLVEEGWASRLSAAALEERIRAALAALSSPEGGSHVGP